jgi:RIO-like serine/threonine protein kinase
LLNIATPRPLAYIEQRKGFLVEKSYLITEHVEGQRLYEFLRDDNVTDEQRTEILQMIKVMLEKLAKYRITHGDLKHTNILITEAGPILTDLDGMTVHCLQLTYKNRRIKDIERFMKGTNISIVQD